MPGWALAVAVVACAGVFLGMVQAFAGNRCALRLGPTGYPYAHRPGHGCFVQVQGVWASEADWVQAPDGSWRRAAEVRKTQEE